MALLKWFDQFWRKYVTCWKNSFVQYCKFPKYSDTQNICCNHSKIWTMWLYHRVRSPNDADGMADSVDPDQTRSSLIWVCTVCPGISVRKLRIITISKIIWAWSWKNLVPYVNKKGTNQPAHQHSLISAFVIRCLDSMISILAKSKISRL